MEKDFYFFCIESIDLRFDVQVYDVTLYVFLSLHVLVLVSTPVYLSIEY